MAMASLTRRVSFAAAHRYRRAEWTDEQNRAVFGACANPNFHGHSYTCEVTVRGEIDETTGMVVDLRELDSVLGVEVKERFDHRNINLEVAEFAEGKLIPTGENLARFIFEQIQRGLAGKCVVTRVVIREDDTMSVEYCGE